MHYNTGQDFVRETKCIPHCLLFLCKTGWQHCSVTAKTPLDILQTHRCTVSHHQCTTTLVRTLSEKQNAFLTAFCFSAKQADSIVVSVQIDLWVFPHHIGVQCPSHQCTAALVKTKCIPHCPVLLCKTGWQHCIVTAKTPLNISQTHRCAVSNHQCTAALVKTKCIPHCPVLLCKTGWQHCSVTGKTPLDILQTHRCAVSHHQCTTTLVRTLSEKQNAFLTAFCFSAKQADSIVVSLQRHLWIFLKHTGVQWPSTSALQHWSRQNAFLTALCCSAKQVDSIVVSLQRHLWIFFKHTDVQCPITNALQHWSRQIAFLTALCCYAKQADSIVVSLERHLWIFCKHTGVQCAITNALQHWSGLCQRNKMHSSLPFVSLQNRLTAL